MILSKVDKLDFETLTHKFETFVSQGCQQEVEKTTYRVGKIFANNFICGTLYLEYIRNFYNSLIKGYNQIKKQTKNLNRYSSKKHEYKQ